MKEISGNVVKLSDNEYYIHLSYAGLKEVNSEIELIHPDFEKTLREKGYKISNYLDVDTLRYSFYKVVRFTEEPDLDKYFEENPIEGYKYIHYAETAA